MHRIELERFGRDDVERQLEAILGAAPAARLVDLVHERSEGNAFLVEEILGAVQSGADPDELPLSLRDVLLTRVERLSPAAQRLLRIAAAAGPRCRPAARRGRGPRGRRARRRRCARRVEHHVLVADGARGYVFRHALTRDAVYGDTLARERARIHAAYGEALVRRPGARRPRCQRARAARPPLVGRPRPAARARGLGRGRAHRRPLRAGRGAAAPRARARAVAPGPRRARAQRHRHRRGAAPRRAERYAAGALDRSLALFDEALAELEPGADPERRALLMEARAAILPDLGRDDEAQLPELERAAALLPAGGGHEARAVVLGTLAAAQVVTGDFAAPPGGRAGGGRGARGRRPGRRPPPRMMLGIASLYLGDSDSRRDGARDGGGARRGGGGPRDDAPLRT